MNIRNSKLGSGYVINGRFHSLPRIAFISRASGSRWHGETTSGVKFAIEGGKKSGGSSRDWFLDIEDGGNGSINCTSFVDAITCINNA